MSIPIFMALCGLSVAFLVYVLLKFWDEGHRSPSGSGRAITFGRPSNPNLIVVTHPVSLSAQGGISVMPLQPQTPGSTNNSVCKGKTTVGKARVLRMPANQLYEAGREATGGNKLRNSLKVS